MGKAVIVSEQGEGLYTVQLAYNTELYERRIAGLDEQILELESRIIDANLQVWDLEDRLNNLRDAISDALYDIEQATLRRDGGACIE